MNNIVLLYKFQLFFGTFIIIVFGLDLKINFFFIIALTVYSVLISGVSATLSSSHFFFIKTAKGFGRLISFPCNTWIPIMRIGVPVFEKCKSPINLLVTFGVSNFKLPCNSTMAHSSRSPSLQRQKCIWYCALYLPLFYKLEYK